MESVIGTRWRMLAQRPPCEPPPQGLNAVWHQAAGLSRRLAHRTCAFLDQAEKVVSRQAAFRHLTDRRLRRLMTPLRLRFQLRRDSQTDREMAFAILCEVAARTVGLRPYREQIAAALALEAGCVAEMATGEGKTLVATLPAAVAGWRGRGCHVITANDYLAGRDAELMAAVYRFCGLTVGCIRPDMPPAARKQAYNAHVTYGTNKEIAADFLRDRLLKGHLQGLPAVLLAKMAGDRADRVDQLVQRGLECAIVDEADAVFIDEAVTPLLISGQGANEAQSEAYVQAAQLARQLDAHADFRIDSASSDIQLTRKGRERLDALTRPLGGVWRGRRRREELTLQALTARIHFQRNQHYVVQDDRVLIVDEFTGRLVPDRTWRHGLHQAIEAKEGLTIHPPKETQARISFQRFFRRYRKLGGMSGTVAEARAELWGIYRLPVVTIPTHRPCRRIIEADRIFTTETAKWRAVLTAITTVHRTGRPILVGTGSIRASAHLSDLLTTHNLTHRLLNAEHQAEEADIIAAAGQMGQITVATNMAGRGTDIRLGPGVADRGGLHVIATERFEARRIDRQLFGRCARQGDPGSAQAFVSLEDELSRKFGSRFASRLLYRWGRQREEISSAFWRRRIEALQRRAENIAQRARREVLRADSWFDAHLGFAPHEL